MYCKSLAPPRSLVSLSSIDIWPQFCSPVGPAVEAFGFERIVYGSSPSPVSHAHSNAGDWYEIAREAFAELGVDQESVDAVFGGNAQRIYVASSGHT